MTQIPTPALTHGFAEPVVVKAIDGPRIPHRPATNVVPIGAGVALPPASARPILFLHIPKTAGTSFLLILRNLFGESRMVRLTMDEPGIDERVEALVRTRLNELTCVNGHVPFRVFAPHMAHFRGFTLLRNPVARVLSLYRFLRKRNDPSTCNVTADTSLDAFLDDRTTNVSLQTNNGMCRMLSRDESLTSSAARTATGQDHAASIVEGALETLRQFDFGLVEHMEQTRRLMRDLWNLPFTPADVVVNTTAELDSAVTSAQVNRIVEMNTLDIALYERAAGLFRDRMQHSPSDGGASFGVVFRPEINVVTPLSDVPGREGFHEYEPDGFAWINNGVQARVHFHAPAGGGRIVLVFFMLTADFPAEATLLRLNGARLAHEVLHRDGSWITLRSAPAAFTTGINMLAIDPPYFLPMRHVQPGSGDDRYLSMALSTVSFVS